MIYIQHWIVTLHSPNTNMRASKSKTIKIHWNLICKLNKFLPLDLYCEKTTV